MNTARGVLLAAPPPRRLPFPLSLTLNPLARPIIAAQARKQVAARARREHYPAPYAILDLWMKYDGDALAPPPGDPASIAHLLQTPTAMNLIRVYKLQERLEEFRPRRRLCGQARACGRRRHHGRRHRRVVRAARPRVTLQDQNAERLAPAMGRAAKLFNDRLKDPRRVRDALDRLVPDVAGDGIAHADVIIEAIFENLDAKQELFVALERKAKPTALLATNTSSIPLEQIAAPLEGTRPADRAALFQSGRAHDAGRDRRRRANATRRCYPPPRRSCARSTSYRCR